MNRARGGQNLPPRCVTAVLEKSARQAIAACRLRLSGNIRCGKDVYQPQSARDTLVPEDYHRDTSGGS